LTVAHSGGEFVVVYKTPKSPAYLQEIAGDPESSSGRNDNSNPLQEAEGKVHYFWNGKKISIPVSQFIQSWSGVILLAETTPDSIEPNYQTHRKKELLNIAQKSILILAVALIFGITFFNQLSNANQLFRYSVIPLLSYSVTQFDRRLHQLLIGIETNAYSQQLCR
jgi:hypothetical protein